VECSTVAVTLNNPTNLQDNCASGLLFTFSLSTSTVGTACSFTLRRTFTLNDGCNNIIENTQNVFVSDTQAPTFNNVPAQGTLLDNCLNIVFGPPTANDACSGNATPTFSDTNVDITNPCRRTIQRTWFASDSCGRQSSVTSTYVVVDVTAPTSNSQTAFNLDCANNPQNTPASIPLQFDSCNTPLPLASTDFTPAGPFPAGNLCAYTFTRVWNLRDNCLNSRTFQQTYTVQDNTPPQVTFSPVNQVTTSISCTVFPTLPVASFSSSDNCQAAVSLVTSSTAVFGTPNPATCFQPIRRTFTFTDGCAANTVSIFQDISITDGTGPIVTPNPLGPVLNVQCNSNGSTTTGTASATDACDTNINNPTPTLLAN